MNKLKHKIDRDLTIAPNAIFRDTELSYKAKGLWLQIISLPEGWDFSVAGLACIASDGRESIQSALNELKKGGWLEWNQGKSTSGKFANIEVVTKIPCGKTVDGKTVDGKTATIKKESIKKVSI